MSRALKKMREGKTASCTKLNFSDSRAVEIACLAGFDCIWTDMEHVAGDWLAAEKQILAAKAYQTDIIVRVSRGSYSDLIKPLELDASGIMVPHVMNTDDAREIVRTTRFHPLGRRPIDGGNADGGFCTIPVKEYLSRSNEEKMLIVQIEDAEAEPYIDEIARIDGIDVLFFGPGDYSHSLGVPGQTDHPDVEKARRKVAESARKYHKIAGTVSGPDGVNDLREMGYQFISVGADVVGLYDYFSRCRTAFG